MNKIENGYLLISVGLIALSCSSPQGERTITSEAKTIVEASGEMNIFNVDTLNSIVEWKGTKHTGEHFGTVNIKKGKIQLQDGKITGGKFTMDMTSIKNIDLVDQEWNKKLVDHLNSSDFFNIVAFPEATFEITGTAVPDQSKSIGDLVATNIMITGNLTIIGISKSITFPALVNVDKTKVTATSPEFLIDRTEWDIKFQSKKFFDDLKDKFIYDNIALKITLVTQAVR